MLLGYSFVFHAVAAAYLSIGVGIIQATLTILAGLTDVSMSLYAVALMSILDVFGGVLILTLWQNRKAESSYLDKYERIEASETEEVTDLWYSFIIGLFMLLMGLVLIIDRFDHPHIIFWPMKNGGQKMNYNLTSSFAHLIFINAV
jgi:hypothetical protein